MNAERLLALYERVAEAPDAITRLRRFILDLAVRGKLVPQDPNDEPASELLKRIAKEKARLVKAGQARRLDVDPVLANDAPFLVPSNWEWTRLGSVGDWGSGSTPPRGNSDLYGGGVTWLKSGELNDNRALIGSEETLTEVAVEKGSFRINQPGDVLIAMYGATIGKVAILGEAAVTNQAVCGCTPFLGLLNQFLFLFLLSQRQQFQSASEGGAQPNISKVKIVWTAFPLPPLAEQHRIVAKVDELMALCDRLEATRKDREAKRDRLSAASLARLNTPDPETFTADARFTLEVLPALTTRPNQIKQLRQTILNLAVRGKLVPQDPNDEPASVLLRRIKQTGKTAMRGGGGSSDECTVKPPYEPAEGWIWTTFSALPIEARVGLDRGKAQQGSDLKFGYFKMNNIANYGGMDLTSLVRIDASNEEVQNFRLQQGDFLFNTRNSRELVGKTCIFRDFNSDVILYNNNILRAKFHHEVCPDFVDIWFRCSIGREMIENFKSNTTNVCAIYQGKLFSYPCPLPPHAEQHRIVAKVDELMALCDRLEASLTTSDQTRTRLLEATLTEALSPASLSDMEAVE